MIWLLVIVIVVLLAAVCMLAYRQRRSAQLRSGFGPEYDRVVEERGDQGKAEAELRERQQRRRGYDIHPLDPEAQARFAGRWQRTQARFVDQPASALTEAHELVDEVMRARGYPVDDFERQAGDVSVDHPELVEHYRKAHAIRADDGASTEDLRQGLVHYRALFAELLEPVQEHPTKQTQEVT